MTQTAIPAKPSARASLAALLARPGCLEAIIFFVAIVAFLATTGFQFVYDDRAQVLNNPEITSWHRVISYFGSDVWASFDPTRPQNYYRPLFFVWFRLNYLFFKLQPAGWHIAAVLLHATASLLAFRFAARLTGDRFTAAIAALLFAVHPVHIESVAWISGTTDPLMAIFLLSAVLCFLDWLQQGSTTKLVATAALYALALLCKEPAIMLLPFLAVLAWFYPIDGFHPADGRKLSRAVALRNGVLPLAVLTVAYLALRAHLLSGAAHNVNQLSLASVIYTLPAVALFYLRQSLVPVGLSFAYEMPPQLSATWQFFWMPLLVLVLVKVLFLYWYYRSPRYRLPILMGGMIFGLWIIPELNLRWLPAEELVHDRYLYLPILGACLLTAILLRQWSDRAPQPESSEAQAPATSASFGAPQLATAAVLIVLLLAATISQQLDCASDLLLWTRAVRISPHSEIALCNLGTILFERGEMAEGFQIFQKELQINPSSQVANYNIGYALYNQHDFAAAEPFVQRALAVAPQKPESSRLLGSIELHLGRLDLAEQLMRQAVSIAPRGEGFHNALAVVLLERGDRAGAERELLQELQLFPDSQTARQALAQIRSGH
jgi:tetratricopeptide (TPR) repeat protein